jgi:hypothetical protein
LTGAVARVGAFRHDACKAHLAGMAHQVDTGPGCDRFAQQDPITILPSRIMLDAAKSWIPGLRAVPKCDQRGSAPHSRFWASATNRWTSAPAGISLIADAPSPAHIGRRSGRTGPRRQDPTPKRSKSTGVTYRRGKLRRCDATHRRLNDRMLNTQKLRRIFVRPHQASPLKAGGGSDSSGLQGTSGFSIWGNL